MLFKVLSNGKNQNQMIACKHVFSDKTLRPNTATRSGMDPFIMSEQFLTVYEDFYSTLMDLEVDDREVFLAKADELFDEFSVGQALRDCEPDNLRELLIEFEKHDLKLLMDFLIEEEVIMFDE